MAWEPAGYPLQQAFGARHHILQEEHHPGGREKRKSAFGFFWCPPAESRPAQGTASLGVGPQQFGEELGAKTWKEAGPRAGLAVGKAAKPFGKELKGPQGRLEVTVERRDHALEASGPDLKL